MTRRSAARRWSPVVMATVAALAAGCGSTVQNVAGVPAGSDLSVGTGSSPLPGATAPGATAPGTSGAPGIGGPGAITNPGQAARAGTPGAGSAPTGVQRRGGTGTSVPTATDGPGVTPTTIDIGAFYASQAVAAADSGLGAAGISPGDQKAQQLAIIDYVNRHGGVGGRKVRPIFQELNPNQDTQQTYQSACSTWTNDHKVFVMQPQASVLLDQCAANAHALAIDTGAVAEGTMPLYRKFPSLLVLSSPAIDRSMRITIDGLARQHYFSSGAKVGIATWDDPAFTYGVQHAARPALSALGFDNVPVEYVAVPQSDAGLGATGASINSAVLRFHQQGIDHVLLLDGPAGINGAGTLVLLWMRDADTQHYTPRYGLNSTSGFSTLAPELPKAQQIGALGVGWMPSLDLSSSDYPDSKLPADGKLCLQIMTKAGQAPQNSNQKSSELGFCEFYFFLQRVLGRVQGPLNEQTALAAIDAVGSSFQPIATFASSFSASKHDGMAVVKDIAYNPSCNCYRYTSNGHRVS
ncbi:MAG TPA: hypothetical protein VFT62_00800 [Mycobacteriales bacterium]|nr:hypothetical protein [Mycobacteriales bacterium]